ncbi:glycosyltransferase 87 family protein [Leifsonia sp. A12D58]|uniref:glycosyltransferase 87 family protein n=1 Tax=Leifsonia sp. A12D58 TaxID=3397674 RepID=UPI0039E13F1A
MTVERRTWLQTPRGLITGFIAVHIVFLVALLPVILTGRELGDLSLYKLWAEEGMGAGIWQGINVEWVYPIGALVPIVFAALGGPFLYQLLWFLLTTALNAIAVGALTEWGRNVKGYTAAWWWLAFSFVLSPVGLLRLEGLTAPLVIVALMLVARRPVAAAAILAIATWIKVWPAAVFLAVVVASKRRISIVLTGIAVTAGFVLFVWATGGIRFIAGFITMQSDRALQLEAPITTPWVWLAAFGHPDTYVYQNYAIATREVAGPGADIAAAVMTPLMFIAVAGVLVLMLLANRRAGDKTDLMLVGALALSSAFVVFNKVGSPQYMLWIAPVVAVGVAHSWQRWRTPAYVLLAIGVLTTLIFPVFYLPLVDGDPFALVLLTARNLLLIAVFAWSVRALWRMLRPAQSHISTTASVDSQLSDGLSVTHAPPRG